MKLAVQGYTLRDQLSQDPWGTLEAVRDMGLKYVEITGTYGVPSEEFKTGLDKLGLTVSANHVGLDDLENKMDEVIQVNKTLNTPCIILPWIGEDVYAAGWAAFGKRLNPIGRRLNDAGFQFAYHNHAFEFKPEGGKPGYDVLFETADPNLVEAQIDVYWVEYAGESAANYIRKMKGRVPQVHLKDGKLGQGEPHYLEVGHGDLNWDEILAACREVGVEYGAIELDTCPRDPIESVRMSVEFLRGKGLKD